MCVVFAGRRTRYLGLRGIETHQHGNFTGFPLTAECHLPGGVMTEMTYRGAIYWIGDTKGGDLSVPGSPPRKERGPDLGKSGPRLHGKRCSVGLRPTVGDRPRISRR